MSTSKRNGKANQPGPGEAPPSPVVPEPAVQGADGTSEARPDPEVVERATRRHYSARYKLRILRETDGLPDGEIGAFLRREGLYWSLLSTWRRQREDGVLAGLEPRQRGPKTGPANQEAKRISQLEKEKAKLQEQLRKLSLVVDVQKKILLLCGEQLPDENT